MTQSADRRLVTFHIPRKDYVAMLDYANKARHANAEGVILFALRCATDRIGLTPKDWEDIAEEMRRAGC